MNISDFIININERYKTPKDPEDAQRQDDLYRQDFGFYSESKLGKVWLAIKRYNKSNFAPNYSSIIECMDKAGIGESQQFSSYHYQRCTKCGTKYAMGVCSCPKCNKNLKLGEIVMNELEVVKSPSMPSDVIFLRQSCPICPIFRGNSTYPRGVKCNDYQGEMRGMTEKCDTCPCKACCMDLGNKNEDMDSGTLMSVVSELVNKKRSK